MDKKVEQIIKDCNQIADDAESKRAQAEADIAATEAKIAEAKAAKENAADADAYVDAVFTEQKEGRRLEFQRKALAVLDGKAMTEAEYSAKRQDIRSCAEEAAAAFRKKAEGICTQLAAAYGEYSDAMDGIADAAEALDRAAGPNAAKYGQNLTKYSKSHPNNAESDLYIGRKSMTEAADPVRVKTWELVEAVKGYDPRRSLVGFVH